MLFKSHPFRHTDQDRQPICYNLGLLPRADNPRICGRILDLWLADEFETVYELGEFRSQAADSVSVIVVSS